MNRIILTVCGILLGTFAAWMASASDVAKHMVAEEITGVVVDAETGKPIPNAVAAIRFERGNTGHSSPHCFRSMAVVADAQGRFKFPPWTQDNTRADATFGQVTAYKAGYAKPSRLADMAEIHQARRSLLGVSFSDTIKIPRQEARLELKPYVGTDEERIEQLAWFVRFFACASPPGQAYSNDVVLLNSIRDEIASSPVAHQKYGDRVSTPFDWINAVIKLRESIERESQGKLERRP